MQLISVLLHSSIIIMIKTNYIQLCNIVHIRLIHLIEIIEIKTHFPHYAKSVASQKARSSGLHGVNEVSLFVSCAGNWADTKRRGWKRSATGSVTTGLEVREWSRSTVLIRGVPRRQSPAWWPFRCSTIQTALTMKKNTSKVKKVFGRHL